MKKRAASPNTRNGMTVVRPLLKTYEDLQNYKSGIVTESMLPPAPVEGSNARDHCSWTVKMTCFDLIHLQGRNKSMADMCTAHGEALEADIGVDTLFGEQEGAGETNKRPRRDPGGREWTPFQCMI